MRLLVRCQASALGPRYYRNTEAIVEQAVAFSRLAPNMVVTIPVTCAGIPAIEEATYRGVSINATVCFTLPQYIGVAEALERGLRRREIEGKDVSSMGPVCTIMVGRLDDWLKVLLEKGRHLGRPRLPRLGRRGRLQEGLSGLPGARLLAETALGGVPQPHALERDAVISAPYGWQRRLNASGIEVRPRIDDPVDANVVGQLLSHFPDFRRAYSRRTA
jgi:transaldolase